MSSSSSLGKINNVHIESVKTLYVAGPFIGKTPWDTHLNAHAAMVACADIWAACGDSVFVLSPHQNTREMVGVSSERTFVVGYLKAVDMCQGTLILDGWEYSKGTKGEILRAAELKKAIHFAVDEAIRWALGVQDPEYVSNCGLCGTYVNAPNWMYAVKSPVCDACISKAWDDARYQPEELGNHLRERGFIDD